ncbi:unnamed protein product [Ceutorhynchus assimilis]|uniref:Sushi, von Willebrand factor type A, EGF and pentraxin domain containing 1 n=1 Tax=Ceutorhynchus assimilis TaxID=467358 RepID=A0A9N9MHQ5_9CUCU|nr:unnamed protein product [Ceutorhynchus assimilis]
MNLKFFLSLILLKLASGNIEKLNLDALNNYSEFLNFGDKKLHKINGGNSLENDIFKSKLDVLGEVFKKNVDFFKVSQKLDIVFLVDASSSVGDHNFKSELKFIKKLLSDITVDYNHTRVAVVTFSSPSDTIKNIDAISNPLEEHNKCLLLNDQLMNIEYKGGETYTIGAFKKAKEIFHSSNRNDSKKVIFLVTDGYSNGENPVPLSNELKNNQITIFTIGISNGNYKELYELSSKPGEFYSYLLDSFEEFESLARRALHVDLSGGDYLPLGVNTPCDKLCDEKANCCDENALCTCGTTTGHYSCTCQPGFYGSGMKNNCLPCTPGTYSDGPNLCLPCPDVHHTTITPAHGIQSCVCKRGFQADEAGIGCKIMKCSLISAPDHGYIVKKKECSNILNSACGLRCEVGYTLVGSSIRLCQEDASWSGSDPTCEVKTCNKLATPKYGSVKCEQTDLGVVYEKTEKKLPVDTVCNFTCEKGNSLIGSTQRTCLPIAQWDGLRTICKPIKCQKLPQIKYGKVKPASCMSGKQEFGKTCEIVCDEGFEVVGTSNKTCGNHGLWGKKGEDETICTDVTAPNLICPENITSSTIPGTNYGQVIWQEPNITDNSGLEVSVWLKPGIINITDYKFSIGLTPVTYFAQDAFNNVIKCTFFVEILDKEPPTIEGCENPSTFLVALNSQENITWDEPNIFDNSQNVTVKKNHEFGNFKIGTTLVTYTAKDPSGNVNICNINITLEVSQCPEFVSPSNGQSECQNQTEGVQCVITCEEGYAIPLQSFVPTLDNSTSFVCNHAEAMWFNQEGLLFPECTVSVVPDETIQEGDLQVSVDGDSCNDTKKIQDIENSIKSSISNTICTSKDCNIDITSECEAEKSEEDTNKISRRKRQSGATILEEVPHKNLRHKKKKKMNLKFQVRGKYSNESIDQFNVASLNGTVKMKKVKFVCPKGFIPRKNRCVQCPRGTFHNSTSNVCQSCNFGNYSDTLGQTRCTQCPPNHSTRKMHTKSFKECREMCPPGTHARKKKIKLPRQQKNVLVDRLTLSPYCKSCPIGTYQAEHGRIKCTPCPPGYTTTKTHSTNISSCISTATEICKTQNICNYNGKCIAINQYEFTCECFAGFFGPRCETQMSPCDSQPCNNGGSCNSWQEDRFNCSCPQNFTGKFCDYAIGKETVCDFKCDNGGTCLDVGENEPICVCPPGYSGDRCEAQTKYCENLLCENNSTCVEQGNSFNCICAKGFMGRRCNILPCDYKPCEETAICINLELDNTTKSDFKCVCPEGYAGPKCLEKIDYCLGFQCENNGKCINEETNFRCDCGKLYYGQFCEFKRDPNYMLNFSRYDVNDYVRLRGFDGNLTEITACLWLQTLDNFNYGTLLSYATRYMDNAFTLTDYTGLVFYINNKYIVTDVFLNDGYWHHICATWNSNKGSYQIYVDGTLIKNGTDLATDSTIEGHGYLIIGQEQDVLGGRFSQSESFVGNMAYVDLWSKVLSLEEIMAHQNDCSDSVFGDLYAWPEMQEYTNGNIQRLPSAFCQKCEDPKPLYNGFIDMVDNKAFYSCYEGFELSSKQFLKGRKCTKTSKWEGFYEPYCKRINCGYPGIVKNGYTVMGNQYFYNDKISYQCFDGFNMTGSLTIICKEDGKWYPKKPKCIGVQCTLPTIPNGKIQTISEAIEELEDSTKVDLDTQISISCHENASLVGNLSVATCLENGTWDNANFTCKLAESDKLNCEISRVPQPPENSYIDEESLQAAKNRTTDFVIYKCQPGHKSNGSNTTTCITDGYWTEPNLTCKAILCQPPQTMKMMLLKNKVENYKFGTVLNYQCQEGYKMIGNNAIRCTLLGRWSKMQGKCIRLSCGKPHVSSNAQIVGNSYLFGDDLTVTCQNKETYKLTCGKDALWNGQIDANC